jgi:rhodanese-related sulfurtransferase
MIEFYIKIYTERILTFFALLFFTSPLLAEQKPFAPESIEGVTIVTAEQVIEMILDNPDLVVIDSRKKTEYLKGHIEGAANLLNTRLKPEDLERVAPDKDSAILFYCNGIRCLRSSDSIKKAKSWGYTNLIWFRGGWKEWTEKRLPVITDE